MAALMKPGIAALVLVAGLSGSARAQKESTSGATGAYPAAQLSGGLAAYYGMTPNFANYGLSGTYPSIGGYGYAGYGPGPQFGAHYTPASATNRPQAAIKPAGPSKGIPAKPKVKPDSLDKGATRSLPTFRKGL